MSSSQPPSSRSHHQDYIARIRYVNNLPPPPLPPKLLRIPGEGLAAHHTAAAYGTRLLRDAPLNLETDAELGMPLDLVGLPGVFDNDFSALSGLDAAPAPHPADRALLRNYKALGAHNAKNATFLRRTEFTASPNANKPSPFKQKGLPQLSRAEQLKRKRLLGDEDLANPKRILRDIQKSFALAYPEDSNGDGPQPSPDDKAAWAHPANPKLEVLDAYPLLWDFPALPETEGFLTIKFSGPPLPSDTDTDDPRTLASLMRVIYTIDGDHVRYEAERREHDANAALPRPRLPTFNYEFYAPEVADTPGFKRAVDFHDPQRDDDAHFPGLDEETGAKKPFNLHRVRAYETERQYSRDDPTFGEQLVMALHDGDTVAPREKAAYLYPVSQRVLLRPRRARPGVDLDEGRVDIMEVTVRDQNDDEREMQGMAVAKAQGL